jgi:hypothetical protein
MIRSGTLLAAALLAPVVHAASGTSVGLPPPATTAEQGAPTVASPGPRPSPQGGDAADDCSCGRFFCLGLCTLDLDPRRGFFALGQSNQYIPPASGWSVIVPPIPPATPRPGEEPARPVTPRPWAPLFFDNNFRYLDDARNVYLNPFDFTRRIPLTPSGDIRLDFGGEFRWQGKMEDNRRLLGFENDYNLFRERLYLDAWYRDRARAFVEVLWADSSRQTLPPLPIDINHGDLLNAFGELKFFERDATSISFRGGRQELFYGNQRLVSPLDWANTRRTFQGYKLLFRSPYWAVDGFWTQPVAILPRAFDEAVEQRQFFGVYGSYRRFEDAVIEPNYLGLVETDLFAPVPEAVIGDQVAHTFGFRLQTNRSGWIVETELAYQFGEDFDLDRSAGMATVGLGRKFDDLWGDPELFIYVDYASGDDDPTNGTSGTFNQLFPLGHKYFGYMDLVGRQNILDPNVIFKIYPSKRINLLLWYHHFELASARDALYNAGGIPIRVDPTGRAGTDVGDEIDVLINLIVNPNTDFQIGYSHFFPGSFLERTGPGEDANFFYSQFTFRF